jgi:hypothetical protein
VVLIDACVHPFIHSYKYALTFFDGVVVLSVVVVVVVVLLLDDAKKRKTRLLRTLPH